MDSFLSWIGGKKLLRNNIIQEFPNNKEYNRYVEVFGGAGWVLFTKDRQAKEEIYNDINSSLVNLFKCVKYHAHELQRELNFMINSRELFLEYINQKNSKGLTDIQRAARYYYIIKLSYGANASDYGAVKKDVQKMKEYLEQIQQRLTSVVVENNSFEKVLAKYDKQDALFYLDPPYHSTEYFYDTKFNEDTHIKLRDILQNIQGKFVLSYNDDDFIRKLYKGFNIIEVERNHNLTSRYNKNRRYKELIIKNY